MRYSLSTVVLLLLAVAAGCARQGSASSTSRNAAGADMEELPGTANLKGWELKPPAKDAQPVQAKGIPFSDYPAGSRFRDLKACEDHSGTNYPFDLEEKDWGTKGAIALLAFPDELVACGENRGIALRLINRTGKVEAFRAWVTCLYLVQEAQDSDGHWHEIENSPRPSDIKCGNGSHRVFIKSDQYWQFPAPLYSGEVKTKIRFRLDPTGPWGDRDSIYSNEFTGTVAATQFRAGRDLGTVQRLLRNKDPKTPGLIADLADLLKDDDASTRRAAASSLAQFGPAAKEAVPALEAAMTAKDPRLRIEAAYAVWQIDGQTEGPVKTFSEYLDDPANNPAGTYVFWWLRRIGPKAKGAIPTLCKLLAHKEDHIRGEAARTLGMIHSEPKLVVPALIEKLEDAEWLVRAYAGDALGRFGPDAKSAVPKLTAALKDEEPLVQVDAALALWRIEAKDEPSVSALIRNLTREGTRANSSAAHALGEIGPPAKPAVPDLLKALKADYAELKIAAAGALWKITAKAEPSLETISQAILDSDSGASESNMTNALEILADMGPKAKSAVPAILKLYDRDKAIYGRGDKAILEVLERIDKEAAEKAASR